MIKNVIVALSVLLACANFIEAKQAHHKKQRVGKKQKEKGQRTIGGWVTFSNPVPSTPSVCPGSSTACSTILISDAKIVQGCEFFTIPNNVGHTLLVQNPCPTDAPCPANVIGQIAEFEVKFKKPFKHVPAVIRGVEITPPMVGEFCDFGFTAPFSGGITTPPVLQRACDSSTTFLINIIASTETAMNITRHGFTSRAYTTFELCPLNDNVISRDNFCLAAQQLAAVILTPTDGFHYGSGFVVVGR